MRPRLPRIARGVVLGLALAGTMTATMTGAAYAIDMINKRGEVEGYTIVPSHANAQSKIDITRNEAGGTMQGYGVKLHPPGHRMAGQNQRSIAVVMQYVDGKKTVVWPKQLRTAEPIPPLPPGHACAL